MKKRYIFICVLVLVLVIAGLIVALKGGNSAVDDVSTNVPTQEITEENNAPESNPTSVPTEIPTSVPTDDSESATQEPTPTLSLEITKIPHSILTSTPNPTKGVDEDEEIDIPFAPTSFPSDDNNEDKPNKDDAIDFDDGQEATPNPTPSISETPTPIVEATKVPTPTPKVEVTPTKKPTSTPTLAPTSTPTPTPKPIITPNVGDDSGETIKLGAIGVEVPKRDSFNHEALENTKTSTWYGKVGDREGYDKLLSKLDEIRDTLIENHVIASGDQAFLYTDNVITFDYLMKGANSDLELHRDTTNGEYVLEINSPLDYDYYKHYDVDFAPYNRDIVLHFCSLISSTPSELMDYIMIGLFEDASILNSKVPQKVGDCQVLFDKNSYAQENNWHIVFHIKGN